MQNGWRQYSCFISRIPFGVSRLKVELCIQSLEAYPRNTRQFSLAIFICLYLNCLCAKFGVFIQSVTKISKLEVKVPVSDFGD